MAGTVKRSMVMPSYIPNKPALPGRLFAHLRMSLPPLVTTIVGAACWATVMAASASAGVWANGWQTAGKLTDVATLYASGAAIAFPLGLVLARFVSLGRSAETAFAAAFLGFSLSTVGVTAILFAFDYRQYYVAWHDEPLTLTWAVQFAFTTANALIQFAVLGLRLFFPIGFIALIAASLWFARSPR
jgi:hypothetical protein